MEQLNKEKLDLKVSRAGPEYTKAVRMLASRRQENLDAKDYGAIIYALSSDIAIIGGRLPRFTIDTGGSEIRDLYFGGLAYFGKGITHIGLACFKLLYSLEDYAQEYARPFDQMVLTAADKYRSFAQEYGAEYLNELNVKEQLSTLKGGCFIATAAYGTEFAPDVMTLKQYRDGTLLKSRIGRASVQVYYFFSPPIAKVIEMSGMLRKLVRNILVRPLAKVCRWKGSYTKEMGK